MISRVLSLALLLVAATLIGCAQGKHGIKRVSAFLTERMPGNIPVDPNGEPLHHGPDSIYIIYIEGNKQIVWDSAWLNGKQFVINVIPVNDFPVQPGTEKGTGKTITLTPEDGNKLWQLNLEPVPGKAGPPREIGSDVLLLRGRSGETIFFQEVKKLLVLVTTNSV